MTTQLSPASGDKPSVVALASEIVAAYIARNTTPPALLPDLINSVFQALSSLGREPGAAPRRRLQPAVPVARSVTPGYIVCLEDGRRLKMLKRHLRSVFNMTPEEYRAKWGLPRDYPMVAPAYAERRSELAKTSGLGRKSQSRRRGKNASKQVSLHSV